jgi:hypothetical protein
LVVAEVAAPGAAALGAAAVVPLGNALPDQEK